MNLIESVISYLVLFSRKYKFNNLEGRSLIFSVALHHDVHTTSSSSNSREHTISSNKLIHYCRGHHILTTK